MREPRSYKKAYRRPSERDGRSRSPQARREPPKDPTPIDGTRPRQSSSITNGRPQPWGTVSRPARRAAADTSRSGSFNLRSLLFGDTPRPQRSEGLQRVGSPDNRPAQQPRSPSSPTLYTIGRPVTRLDSVRPVNPFQADPQRQTVPPTAPPTAQPKSRRERRSTPPLLHLVRLLIFGLGIGAIAGTTMALVNPTARLSDTALQATAETASPNRASMNGSLGALSSFVRLSQEMRPLTATVQELAAQVPDITPGVYLVDLDTGAYLNVNGGMVFPAASTIKVPVLVAFLQDVDAGKIRLDELLTMEQGDISDEAGVMQYQPVGTQYTALETAEMMISISDNTATNILIRRMGGMLALNQRFQSWGLTNTVIRNPLADLGGTNTTTPQELTELLVKVSQGELLSLRSRDRLMEIMQSTVTDTLIPTGIGDEKAIVAHKTGTINGMVGDTGIVDMPSGKRFVVTVLAQRPAEDDRAQEMIRQICGAIYEYLKQPPAQVPQPSAPPASTAPTSPQG